LLLLLLQVAVAAVVAVAVVALPVLQLFVLGCLLNTFRYTLAIAKSPPFRPHSHMDTLAPRAGHSHG